MWDLTGHFKDFGPALYQVRIYSVSQAEGWHHLTYIFKKNLSGCVLRIDLSEQTQKPGQRLLQ